MKQFRIIAFILLVMSLPSCVERHVSVTASGNAFAAYFSVHEDDTLKSIVTLSPYGDRTDTLAVDGPFDRIVCLSSSHVAALSIIGASGAVCGVSGLKFITDTSIRNRRVPDVGPDTALDYETILSLKPDLLVTYAVAGTVPPYIDKLRGLGVRTLVLHDHLENHPLARAEYIRLFGALTGRQEYADSVFSSIRDRYLMLAAAARGGRAVKVLVNFPYGDAWYVPGGESYMSKLVADAGGEVLGAEPGKTSSSVISLEEAYMYSLEADMWLNPGPCRTRSEIMAFHPMLQRFGPIAADLPIYNNIRCVNAGGGNDFWERGAVRPDLVLEDLVSIFAVADGAEKEDSLHFHVGM